MPVFTVSVPMGRLDQAEQQRIAVGITTVCTREVGMSGPSVHVLFHAYPKGAAWSSSRPSAPVIVETALAGECTATARAILLQSVTALLTDVLGSTANEVLVSITDLPSDRSTFAEPAISQPTSSTERQGLF